MAFKLSLPGGLFPKKKKKEESPAESKPKTTAPILLPQSELTQAGAQATAFNAKNPAIGAPIPIQPKPINWDAIPNQHLRNQTADAYMDIQRGGQYNTEMMGNTPLASNISQIQKTAVGTKAYAAEQAIQQAATAKELIGQLGNVTPEQQANIDAATLPDGTLNWNILSENLKRSQNPLSSIKDLATSATSLNVGGAASGLFDITPLGFLVKTGQTIQRSVYQVYDHRREENSNMIANNVARAKMNLKGAILVQNKGGDGVEQFNQAYYELLLAEAQYKRIEREDPRAWIEDIAEKQGDLRGYLDTVYYDKNQRMRIAIQKPDPNYIDYEVQTSNEGDNGT